VGWGRRRVSLHEMEGGRDFKGYFLKMFFVWEGKGERRRREGLP